MAKARLIYRNHWRNGSIVAQSSEHPQFVAEYSQDDTPALKWRSRHGAGSGNGRFLVTAGSNDKIDFCEDASTVVTDGGMEAWLSATNLTSWAESIAGTSTVNREATIIKTGTYSCRLDVDAGNSAAAIYQGITMTAGGGYRLSLYYRTAASKTAYVQIVNTTSNVWLQSDGTWAVSSTIISLPSTSGAWVRYSLVFSAHASYTSYIVTLCSNAAASSSIYFDDVKVLPVLTATLTAGDYTGNTLATEVKTQMDAAGGTYTVTYDEATAKFTIASATAFSLLWLSGANLANNAGALLGFGRTADSYGAITYTSATMVCHTYEYLIADLGAAQTYNFVGLLGHNLTSSATIIVYGADDAAITSNVVSDTITYNGTNVYSFLATARTKRYVMVMIYDVANPSGYVQISEVVVGSYWEPNRSFGPYTEGETDETEVELSPSANLFVVQERPKIVVRELEFKGLKAAAIVELRLLLAEVGISKALILCTDSDAPNTSCHWMRLRECNPPRCEQYGYWTWSAPMEEVL
jgi:hypothetical protein